MNWRRIFVIGGLAVVAGASGEVAARVDDWIRLGVPLMHTPDEEIDLRTRDSLGIHGRPHGQYHQFRLNNFGFRGPDMALHPAPGCTRILVLGASETMGYYESTGKEYPAQLRDSVRALGCYEVVNGGIPGSTVKSLVSFWQNYASRFDAKIVVIYPTPGFYLGVDAPNWTAVQRNPRATPPPERVASWRPRLLERVHNVVHTPDFIQKRREIRWIDEDTRDKPAGWVFTEPPQDRLNMYATDLDSLIRSIRASGATPVLMTHAMRFSIPPRPEDEFLLLAWRHFSPRATSATMLSFERLASQRTRDYAKAANVPLVDVDSAISGKSALFGDFIHFTDEGASIAASLITRSLVQAGLVERSPTTANR